MLLYIAQIKTFFSWQMDVAGVNSKDAVQLDGYGGRYCQSNPKVPAKKVTRVRLAMWYRRPCG
jgi:hypothetical protein